MESNIIMQKLNRLEKLLVGTKKILTVEELTDYSGFSKSYIYKLVSRNQIPFSKPNGKTLFFEKEKIDQWLLQKSSVSEDELQKQAETYIFNNKKA